LDLNLKGKTAIVSGGNKGLGAASAMALAAEGADLFLTVRNAEDLQRTADEITSAHGVKVGLLALDITEEKSGDQIVAAALEEFDRIDILVNAAGAARGGVFHDIDDQV
jgi:short-subunit dehydrogenase